MIQNKIGHFFVYLRRMMKFYDIKARGVPQVLFVLLLAVSFGFVILLQPIALDYNIYVQQVYNTYIDILSSENIEDSSVLLKSLLELRNSEMFLELIAISLKIIGYMLLQQILMKILAYFYMGAYLCDLENEGFSFACYFRKFLKAFPRYAGFNIIFYLVLFLVFIAVIFIYILLTAFIPILSFASGFVVYLIPLAWFIIQVIFIFKDIVFLDTGVSIWRNFRLSVQLSAGNRSIIAKNIIFIVFLNMLIRMFTFKSMLVSLFVVSFLEVIILLIRQRLVVLMYLSRTRRINANTVVEGNQ